MSGQVDLAIGVSGNLSNPGGIELRPAGRDDLRLLRRAAPCAGRGRAPLDDAQLVRQRAIAVADTAQRLTPMTVNLLPGQDVLTVPSMRAKLEALLRGLGCGYVPEPLGPPAPGGRPPGAQGHDAGRTRRAAVLRLARRARPAEAWAGRCSGGWRSWKARRRAAPSSSATPARWTERPAPLPHARRRRCHPPMSAAVSAAMSAASRRRPPGRCTPARWSRRWPAGWTPARTAAAGWCASRTSTRRAARAGTDALILAQLATCGLQPDEPPWWQSARGAGLPGGAGAPAGRRPGLPLRLHAPRHRRRLGRARRRAPAPRRAHLPRHLPRRAARQGGAGLALCAPKAW